MFRTKAIEKSEGHVIHSSYPGEDFFVLFSSVSPVYERIVSQVRPLPLPSPTFPINYSQIILFHVA
jgi:hypothetical protein